MTTTQKECTSRWATVYDTTLKHFLTPLPQDGVLYQVVQQIEQNLKELNLQILATVLAAEKLEEIPNTF
jgi:hypothetical protein